MFVSQTSFSSGEISPALAARTDLAAYSSGLSLCENFQLLLQGGAANRPGLAFVGPAKYDDRPANLIPFKFSEEDTAVLEFGHYYLRVISRGGYVTGLPKAVAGLDLSDGAKFLLPAHGFMPGDHLFFDGCPGQPALAAQFGRVESGGDDWFTLEGISPEELNPFLAGMTAAKVQEVSTPYNYAEVFELSFTQSADVLYLAHKNHPPHKLKRLPGQVWELVPVEFSPTVPAPAGVTVTPSATPGTTRRAYRVAAVAADSEGGVESFGAFAETLTSPATLSASSSVTISWDLSAIPLPLKAVRVYREENGLYRLVRECGPELTEVVDDGTAQEFSTKVRTPVEPANPFAAAGDYPGAVAFHAQRLWWGGTKNQPGRIWSSRLGDFENFSARDPLQEDDPLTFQLASQEVNEVRHLISLKSLLILTSGAEFLLDSGSSALGPSSYGVRVEGYSTTSRVRPLTVGDSVLAAPGRGDGVKEYAQSRETGAWFDRDLTVLARHLFAVGKVKALAYSRTPGPLVWAVLDDGALLTLTYQKEHELFGWSRQTTLKGGFEAVAAVPEGGEDGVYFTVRREVGGVTRRYVERAGRRVSSPLENSFYVDSGVSYEGQPIAALTGLKHLEGELVAVLADGDVHPARVVEKGRITLAHPAGKVTAGLPVSAKLTLLPVAGVAEGRPRQVSRLRLTLEEGRGVWAGPDFGKLTEAKERTSEPYGTGVPLYSGELSLSVTPVWSDGRISVLHDAPLPFTLLAAGREVRLGG